MQQWMAENGGRERGKRGRREGGGNRQPTNQVLPRREGTQGGRQESRHMKESAKAESKQAGEGRAAGRKEGCVVCAPLYEAKMGGGKEKGGEKDRQKLRQTQEVP